MKNSRLGDALEGMEATEGSLKNAMKRGKMSRILSFTAALGLTVMAYSIGYGDATINFPDGYTPAFGSSLWVGYNYSQATHSCGNGSVNGLYPLVQKNLLPSELIYSVTVSIPYPYAMTRCGGMALLYENNNLVHTAVITNNQATFTNAGEAFVNCPANNMGGRILRRPLPLRGHFLVQWDPENILQLQQAHASESDG